MNAQRQAGISIIEVIVALGILALLLGVAMPSFKAYQQNVQIRSAAESILNGIQAARNESIRRNATYEFTVHDGSAWHVCPANDPYPSCATPYMTRAHDEGSTNAVVTVTPAGAQTVAFNGLGRVVTNADGSASVTQVQISNNLVTGAERRMLRILIQPGGALRLCDTQVAAGDPRACS